MTDYHLLQSAFRASRRQTATNFIERVPIPDPMLAFSISTSNPNKTNKENMNATRCYRGESGKSFTRWDGKRILIKREI
ncbi:hypothetical protein E4U21_004835 [Claviceps maximensis]|nr:hypothetical protein E4U21_004835 [Claviceps maximensis]